MTTVHQQTGLVGLVSRAFDNQIELNNKLRPDWASQGWHYYRAIWTEIGEALGHTNWYWWKTGDFGKPISPKQRTEICLELCDMLHFGLSLDLINDRRDPEAYVQAFLDAQGSSEPLDTCLEGIVVDCILLRDFNIKKFARACNAIGLDLPGILAFYFAKSVLNQFRWDNGYNDKTYVKQWRLPGQEKSVEDNVILGELIQTYVDRYGRHLVSKLSQGELYGDIYVSLSNYYDAIEKT